MIDATHALSISRQAQLAGISRGRVYDVSQPVGAADLVLMRRLDALHLEHPFMGARMLRDQLNREEIMSNVGYEALWEQPFLMVPVV